MLQRLLSPDMVVATVKLVAVCTSGGMVFPSVGGFLHITYQRFWSIQMLILICSSQNLRMLLILRSL
jgi:hypothetical protein